MSSPPVHAASNAISISRFFSLVIGVGMLGSYAAYQRNLFPDASTLFIVLYFILAGLLVTRGLGLWTSGTPNFIKSSTATLGRQRIALTRAGFVYLSMLLFIGVGASIGRNNTLLLVFALMAGPYILNGWVIFTMLKKTSATRTVPPRVMAGETAYITIQLTNKKTWMSSRLMVVRDTVRHARESLEPAVLFVRVPPNSERSTAYQLQLVHRGRYRFGPMMISSSYPLGLGERGRVLDDPAEILVHPRIGQLASNWRREFANASALSQQDRVSSGALQDEFHRLREFRAGDNPRDIHWKTSARQRELVVREFRQTRESELIVLLDPWTSRDEGSLDPDLELAISLTATMFVEQARNTRDAPIKLIVANAKSRLVAGKAKACLEAVLDSLSLVRPSKQVSPDELIDLADEHQARNASTILVTTRRDEVIAAIERNAAALRNTSVLQADRNQLASIFTIGSTVSDPQPVVS